MKLQLSNSQIELIPQKSLNIYCCGPTVYNHIHCGNLRPWITFDFLHRLLLFLNIKVNYVLNITDIDDKIIAKAQQEKTTEKKIAERYFKTFLTNLTRYNIVFPNYFPHISDYLSPIQKFIEKLIKKGYAYQHEEEVLFRVEGNKNYGELSGQKLEKLRANSRRLRQVNKIDKKDFSLWKKTSLGVAWNSPWGQGRPGWHTECAVLIQEFFAGETIDIHGGGSDLLFPHHENERIQYLAHNDKELSKVWLHVAHINWKKEKMSKSLGNVILATQFYQKHTANVLRYLIANTHYNQVINLDEHLIQNATNYINKIQNLLKNLKFYLYVKKIIFSQKSNKKRSETKEKVVEYLLNNLNTVKVLYLLEKKINFLNKSMSEEKSKEINTKAIKETLNDFYFILDILGFKFNSKAYDSSTKLLIRKWQELRKEGEYEQADKIRKQLQEINVL
jgi:cysteinyl-tRNA synthetase